MDEGRWRGERVWGERKTAGVDGSGSGGRAGQRSGCHTKQQQAAAAVSPAAGVQHTCVRRVQHTQALGTQCAHLRRRPPGVRGERGLAGSSAEGTLPLAVEEGEPAQREE